MKKCENCGAENPAEMNFCDNCGAAFFVIVLDNITIKSTKQPH